MKKTIYRTVYVFEILSEEPLEDSYSLAEIDEMTTTGHCSGRFLGTRCHNLPLTDIAAVKAVESHGTDPGFFMMDEEGNEIDEDMVILTPVWEDDFTYKMEGKSYEDLSYKDEGEEYVALYDGDKSIGLLKVWKDSDMDDREYIIINYNITYLDTLKKI